MVVLAGRMTAGILESKGWNMRVIELLVACRRMFETAAALAVVFGISAALIGADIYAVYTQLLPWESLWSSLAPLDQLRAVVMLPMGGLGAWYGAGAFSLRPI